MKLLFSKYIGLDKAAKVFFSAKIFAMVATPTILLLMTQHLTAVEQGFYFSFYSLLAISMFFELGMGYVIGIFASHEFSRLYWTEERTVAGDPDAFSRVSSLLRKALQWYGLVSLGFFLVATPLGIYIFSCSSDAHSVNYVLPWTGAVAFFSIGTAMIPITSVLDGCGHVASVQKMRLGQAVTVAIFSATTLLLGGRLYAITLEFGGSAAFMVVWAIVLYRKTIWEMLVRPLTASTIDWRREVLPMQLQIAVVQISNYFQNALFVPIAFAFQGSSEAGRLGMALRLSTSIYTIAIGWINVKQPRFGTMIASGAVKEMEHIALMATVRSVIMSLLGGAILVGAVILGDDFVHDLGNRILSPLPLAAIALTVPANLVLAGMSSYLRAFKKEPFWSASVLMAIMVSLTCLITAYLGTVNTIGYGYCVALYCIAPPLYYTIFTRQRAKERGRLALS